MKKSQRIAFDIDKAEINTKIITRDGHSGKITSIDLKKLDYPISATIELNGKEVPLIFTKEGHFYSDDKASMFDLFIEEKNKPCRMTYQELSKWLRDCPNEFRECKNSQANIVSTIAYKEIEANRPVPNYIVIRRNYGKWEEPIIEK